jgi:hypothetical protein
MGIEDYDPTEFSSAADYARSRAAADAEFGMPSRAYKPGPVGSRVNQIHHDRQAAMNDEFGWGRTSKEDLRRKWGVD